MPSLASISRLEAAAVKEKELMFLKRFRPTRWTDQTALNIADDGGRDRAAFVATLAAGVSAAFSFFSQVAVAAAAAPAPERRRLALASVSARARLLARRLLPSTLVTRARRTKHLAEFLNRQSHFNHGPRGLSAPYFPGPCFQGTECVVFRARTAVMTAGVGRARAVLCSFTQNDFLERY